MSNNNLTVMFPAGLLHASSLSKWKFFWNFDPALLKRKSERKVGELPPLQSVTFFSAAR